MKYQFEQFITPNALNKEKTAIWESEIKDQINNGMTYNEIRKLFGDNIRYYLTKMGIAAPRKGKWKIVK